MNPKHIETIQKQEQLKNLIQQKQKLDSQLNETLMASDEVNLLENDAVIYKLIGPLMVPQDVEEVKQNVKSRLRFLNDRIGYYEDEIKKINLPG